MPASTARFAGCTALHVQHMLADTLDWPRSRPARLLAGDRAQHIERIALCVDEAALDSLATDTDPGTLAVLATSPKLGELRTGRRAYDPFLGESGDVSSWRRGERVVLDAAFLLAGGRGGIDERLARDLDLIPRAGTELPAARALHLDVDKLVAYVPEGSLETVRDSLFVAGAGRISAYDQCSWMTRGTGTFRGDDTTNPTIGTPGSFEQVAEVRLEVVVPRHLMPAVIDALRAVHPYEVPAFDVLLMSLPAAVGFGRIGIVGNDGGTAIWSTLAQIDPDLTAHGKVDAVTSGAQCIVHAGRCSDLIEQVMQLDTGSLLVVSEISDAELAYCASAGIATLVFSRQGVVEAHLDALAGQLTRALELPVVATRSALGFPDESPAQISAMVSASADSTTTPSVFDAGISTEGSVDETAGKWRLHFDGGSRGNPGPAAYGWVLYAPDGSEHASDGVTVGSATNNVAEWTGLLRGLEYCAQIGITQLDVRGDSELVIKQAMGIYKVKNAQLKPIAEQVAALTGRFTQLDFAHVYRADNARADAIANEALDGIR